MSLTRLTQHTNNINYYQTSEGIRKKKKTSEGSMVLTVPFHMLGSDNGGGKFAYK
jgi:hypothetical protein